MPTSIWNTELEELQHEGQSKLLFEDLGDQAALPEEVAKQRPAEVENSCRGA